MLDTVILNFPLDKFDIWTPEMFFPNAKDFLSDAGYGKAVNNPSKEESKWEYYPRMTLYRRPSRMGINIGLRVEFSVPKLLFQNNLDEIKESDFEEVILKLQEKLIKKGVYIMRDNLAEATVSGFHASKNIELNGYITATMAIKELSKIQLTKRLDLTKTDFRNGGHSLQYYSKSHSLVFYDKIADMGKDEKRSIDHDMKGNQKSLFCQINEWRRKTDIEILKMEVRLSQKRKMDTVLEKIGFGKNPNFRDIFKKDVCQKVLLDYWNTLVQERNLHLFQQNKSKKDELMEISDYIANQNGRPTKAVALYAIKDFCKSEGAELFRQIIEDKFGKGSWNNVNKHLKELNAIALNTNALSPELYLKDIEEGLKKFDVFKKEQITS
ncbi:MAG TPA: hypothetical protein P5548_00965 [Candidatus Moranbacteria bacterium]|nr:hypothetical protein [Candidatus Moranbacteria bacterium]HRZ33463.1 hypothetical protein [Candidatus Moranbacteria bacterium]